jgi:hypothetical protein
MIKYIIVVGVITVSGRVVRLKLRTLGGKDPGIRKNPHVTDVGLGPSLQRNYRYIMLTEILTIVIYKI